MSSAIGNTQFMLARVGVRISRRELNKRTPVEISLAEKWAYHENLARTARQFGEDYKVPAIPNWLRPFLAS